MATVPIEIIIQDAEGPVTPTPESGGETNITVPDTGTISNDGSNNGGIGSTISIILPIVIAVLALSAMVALLVRRQQKRKSNINASISKKEKLATVASSTIAILAVTVLIGNLVLPATKAATSDITDGITPSEDKVSIIVTRDGGAIEASIESTATITSTSDFGYKVLLSMAEGVETSNLYLNGDVTSEYYIAPVEVSDDESEAEGTILADNTWGYALTEDGEYSAIPLLANAATVAQGNEPVEDESLSIYYGVKVSSALPAGTYSGGEIEYSLKPSTGFPDSLVYMQDMTHDICAAAPTPGNQVTDPVPTATLIDSRDNKTTYTIAKLADGKCWMTQNLDLDIKTDGSIIYNSTNTNLTVAGSGAYENGYTVEDGVITWTPANATIDFTGDTVEGWQSSNTAPYSANPGDVYYYTSGSDADDIQYNSLAECVAANHTEEDCKHYHAGNYYNWSAAVASNDTSSLTTQYDNAANSICPAGWRLSRNRVNADSAIANNEQAIMISSYDNILGDYSPYGPPGGSYDYSSDGFEIVRTNPLWLSRSGRVHPTHEQYGNYGYYWSSTITEAYSSYNIGFDYDDLYPAKPYGRSAGVSIRCVAE